MCGRFHLCETLMMKTTTLQRKNRTKMTRWWLWYKVWSLKERAGSSRKTLPKALNGSWGRRRRCWKRRGIRRRRKMGVTRKRRLRGSGSVSRESIRKSMLILMEKSQMVKVKKLMKSSPGALKKWKVKLTSSSWTTRGNRSNRESSSSIATEIDQIDTCSWTTVSVLPGTATNLTRSIYA
jgi:hypothetical protein